MVKHTSNNYPVYPYYHHQYLRDVDGLMFDGMQLFNAIYNTFDTFNFDSIETNC